MTKHEPNSHKVFTQTEPVLFEGTWSQANQTGSAKLAAAVQFIYPVALTTKLYFTESRVFVHLYLNNDLNLFQELKFHLPRH